MKIIIFSDSHGIARGMQDALSKHPDAKTVLHCGDGAREFEYLAEEHPDKSFTGVPGNCDFFGAKNPSTVTLDIDGTRILVTHGHRFFVKSSTSALISHARENDIDIAIFGHTHIPLDRYIAGEEGQKPLRLFNPGSVSCPHSGRPTYGIIEIRKNGILTSIAEL